VHNDETTTPSDVIKHVETKSPSKWLRSVVRREERKILQFLSANRFHAKFVLDVPLGKVLGAFETNAWLKG
jgi:hypothetical protein